jgi:hypothetical protein
MDRFPTPLMCGERIDLIRESNPTEAPDQLG